jgi:hypothetical protein
LHGHGHATRFFVSGLGGNCVIHARPRPQSDEPKRVRITWRPWRAFHKYSFV